MRKSIFLYVLFLHASEYLRFSTIAADSTPPPSLAVVPDCRAAGYPDGHYDAELAWDIGAQGIAEIELYIQGPEGIAPPDEGCGCRLAGATRERGLIWWMMGGAGLALARRRGRRAVQ